MGGRLADVFGFENILAGRRTVTFRLVQTKRVLVRQEPIRLIQSQIAAERCEFDQNAPFHFTEMKTVSVCQGMLRLSSPNP